MASPKGFHSLNESGTDDAEYWRRVATLQFECTRVLHDAILVPVSRMVVKRCYEGRKEASRIRDVQTGNLRGLLDIK